MAERVARAREASGVTQESLGAMIGLDRTAITRLESGDRNLKVSELISIAEALHRPMAYFVADPVPAVVSRRRDGHHHESTLALDTELEHFASDVRSLLQSGDVLAQDRPALKLRTPGSHDEAERMAEDVRQVAKASPGPIADLGQLCETVGLMTYSSPIGEHGPDGACVEIVAGETVGAVAVINGDAPAGRRRMTLAHELGHWLAGDAYDTTQSADAESMLNSFAIHLLAPRAGVLRLVGDHKREPLRQQALHVGAKFRLSWSACVSQLRNLGVIDPEQRETLHRERPTRGEYARLGLTWADELGAPYLSPGLTSQILNAYVRGSLAEERTLELLRGTLMADDLPPRAPTTLDDLRLAFLDHGRRA